MHGSCGGNDQGQIKHIIDTKMPSVGGISFDSPANVTGRMRPHETGQNTAIKVRSKITKGMKRFMEIEE
jgi:hypothetical protein